MLRKARSHTRHRHALRALSLVALLSGCTSHSHTLSHGDSLRELAAFVRAAHPTPARYLDGSSFDALVASESERLDVSPDDDALLAQSLHRALATLRDGHVAIALPAFQPQGP